MQRAMHQQNAGEATAIDPGLKEQMTAKRRGGGRHHERGRGALAQRRLVQRKHAQRIHADDQAAIGRPRHAHVVAIEHHRRTVRREPAIEEITGHDPAVGIVEAVADQDAERLAIVVKVDGRPWPGGPHAGQWPVTGFRDRGAGQIGEQPPHVGDEPLAPGGIGIDDEGEMRHGA